MKYGDAWEAIGAMLLHDCLPLRGIENPRSFAVNVSMMARRGVIKGTFRTIAFRNMVYVVKVADEMVRANQGRKGNG